MKKISRMQLVLSLIILYCGLIEAQQNKITLSFRENKGQVSDQFYKPRPDILFSGSDGKLIFHLKNDGISYQLNRIDKWEKRNASLPTHIKNNSQTLIPSQSTTYRLDINWLNASTNSQIIKSEALQGFDNYYSEPCPEGALNVKSYSNIIYKNLYNGIDLKWYEKNGVLKYDYNVAAFADYKKIQLEYKGAEKIYLNAKGELIIETPLGKLIEEKPIVFQKNKQLKANWIIKNNIISFEIKNVDPAAPLIIDPLIRLWGTYFGGNLNEDDYLAMSTDNLGNSYIAGETKSNLNIATTGAYQTSYGGTGPSGYWGDGFIVKFDPNGLRLWSTYYGGAQNDFVNYSAVDANGNVYITGGTSTTNSAVIATPGAYQSAPPLGTLTVGNASVGNTSDAYIAKLNSSGARLWGTYYGGTSYEWAYGIALNSSGDILISGTTNSTDGNSIASPGCHQPVYGGGYTDGFLAVFNSSGVRQWGTYYGGSDATQEDGSWCAYDMNGDIYLAGGSSSTNNISTNGSHQFVSGGTRDAFLTKFSPSGVRAWGTYYGGAGSEDFSGGSIDASGNIYLAGETTSSVSSVITTAGAHQIIYGGGKDGMLVKFNSTGVRQWGSYYGGTGIENCAQASVDLFGNVYFCGSTSSHTGTVIASSCAYQPVYGGGSSDGYLIKFTPNGSRLWGTYYGGTSTENGCQCAVEIHNNVFLSGSTFANTGTIIASSNSSQPVIGGGRDNYLVKFDECIPGTASNLTPLANLYVCAGTSATLSTNCGNWYNTPTGPSPLATGSTFTTGPLISDSTFYIEDYSCGSTTGTRTAVHLTLTPTPSVTVTNSNPLGCIGETITLTASGASTYSWINTSATTATIQFVVLLNTNYTVTGTDANGCLSTAILEVLPNLCAGINEQRNINSSVSIFPNPTNGSFTIQSGNNLNLVLTNELGQTIRSLSLSSINNFQVTVNDLPNGIYFLKGEKENYGLNKKIIVIR